jgi:hypothetical protein
LFEVARGEDAVGEDKVEGEIEGGVVRYWSLGRGAEAEGCVEGSHVNCGIDGRVEEYSGDYDCVCAGWQVVRLLLLARSGETRRAI